MKDFLLHNTISDVLYLLLTVDSSLDDVISKLETPAFSPMDRTFPEPLHQNKKLRWDHKVCMKFAILIIKY